MKKAPGDVIFLHMCTKTHNHVIYASWDVECDRQFFVIMSYSLPFYPISKPQNWNLEKVKKKPGDIILLHICTINEDHIMMYGSWDMESDRQFFVIMGHFLPFYPINNP